MKINIVFFSLLLSVFLTSCKGNNDLEVRLKELEQKHEQLKSQVEFNELIYKLDSRDYAFLKPGDSGYSTIGFDLGNLTIAIDNVIQYAGGVKVTFKIGNPLSSTISGLKATLEYGQLNEKGEVKGEEKSKKVEFQEELRGGSWNRVTVVLEGVELKDLGYVRVKNLAHKGIRLAK